MTELLGDLLPFAAAIALSPFPVVAVVLVLSTPRAQLNGIAFALGWLFGLTALTVAAVALTGGADDPGSVAADGVAWGRLLVGVLLLVTAVRKWRHRPPGWGDAELPAWATQLADASPLRCAGLGAALGGVNPKNLALVAGAGAALGQSGASTGEVATAAAIFVALASSTVVGAVVVRLVAGERAAAALDEVKTFMLRHEAAIMMVILVVFGLKLIGDGLAGI